MQLLPVLILTIPFYYLNMYLAYTSLNTVDAAGGVMLHMFCAYFAMALSWVLQRPGGHDTRNKRKGGTYYSNILSMVGTLFIFVCWPIFNAAHGGEYQQRMFGNTVIGIAAGAVGAFATDVLVNDEAKLTMEAVLNATLAAGVGVASIGYMAIPPGVAVLVGLSSGALSAVGFAKITPFLEKTIGLEDIYGVHNLHGLPGMFSGICAVFITLGVPKERYGVEDGWQVFYTPYGSTPIARTLGEQAGYQFASILITLAVAIVGGLITGFVAKLPIFLPPTDGNAPFVKFGCSIVEEEFQYSDDYFWECSELRTGEWGRTGEPFTK